MDMAKVLSRGFQKMVKIKIKAIIKIQIFKA